MSSGSYIDEEGVLGYRERIGKHLDIRSNAATKPYIYILNFNN